MPARQGWTDAGGSSLNQASQPADLPPVSPVSQKRQSAGDNYYEDVDPRFAQPPPTSPLPPPPSSSGGPKDNLHPLPLNPHEDIRAASRSPVGSERSGYTSASGRGGNARWPAGRPQQRPDVLTSNPDFELPGGRGRGPAPGQSAGSGMVPGSAYPGSGL